jgi:hypothetical protein
MARRSIAVRRTAQKFRRVQFHQHQARVVGMQYHHGHRFWDLLSVGSQIYLEREPENTHDRNAVAVYVHDGEWQRVGYVSREIAMKLAPQMDTGFEVEATIVKQNPAAEVRDQIVAVISLYAYLKDE